MADSNDSAQDRPDAQASAFLQADFRECFVQKRTYESLTWEVAKFTFSAYSTMLAASLGLFTLSADQGINLIPVARALLGVGILVGLFMLLLVVRTRVYFVVVTRYINEQRSLFLSRKPDGFENKSGMIVDSTMPPYFSATSTQSWVALLLATLNSLLLGVLGYVSAPEECTRWVFAFVFFVLLLSLQVASAIGYLKSREGKSPNRAIFGRS